MTRVLFVEDEEKLRNFVREGLSASGFFIDVVADLDEAEILLLRETYDIILLDRLLKGRDSLASISKIRNIGHGARLMILSALAEVDQKVSGLDQGADDYLGKPFHIRELVSRLQALARRSPASNESLAKIILFQDLHINLETQEVTREGKLIDLSAKEFKLLSALASKPKKIFTKQELLDRIWGTNTDADTNIVEVAIARLRNKVDIEGLVSLIHTKRGVGYSLDLKETNEVERP